MLHAVEPGDEEFEEAAEAEESAIVRAEGGEMRPADGSVGVTQLKSTQPNMAVTEPPTPAISTLRAGKSWTPSRSTADQGSMVSEAPVSSTPS